MFWVGGTTLQAFDGRGVEDVMGIVRVGEGAQVEVFGMAGQELVSRTYE